MYAAVASLVALGGCSNDDELETQMNQQASEEGVEVISDPVEIRLGTPGVNFLTRAAFEGDADGFDLGVFCLAREKQYVNHSAQDILWWNTEVDPLWSATFCLLDNVESTKSGGNIFWKDGEHRYYPFTQFYSYDFYAYYPYVSDDDEENTIVRKEEAGNNVVEVTYTNLDGKTDILWGRATSSELYAYSSKYFRQPGNQDMVPIVQLDHMLTRLIFRVVPGESYVGSGDYTAAHQVTVAGLKVQNVVKKATLLVADYNRDSANEHGTETVVGTDEPDRLVADYDVRHTVSLCGADGEPFEPVLVSDNPLEFRQLGESLLLYPEHKYVLDFELRDADGNLLIKDNPLELIYPRDDASDYVFKAGCQYIITIEVHGPKEIEVKAELTDWQDAGLTPEEQDDVNLEL